jgi:tetratricopeptide (TPR) repeat protein
MTAYDGGDSRKPLLVGREDDIENLLKELKKVQSGEGAKVVLISGESGVGKTRMVEDLLDLSSDLGFKVLRSKCLNESVTPYLPIFESLRNADMGDLVSFESPPRVEYINLMSPGGLVMSQQSRSERIMDMDIFSGMLTAVSTFVKDSMDQFEVEEEGLGGNLNSMGYGNYRILIESRPLGNLVVILTGIPTEILMDDMKSAMKQIESEFSRDIMDWGGDVLRVEGIKDVLHPLFSKYDGVDYVREPKDRQWRLFENVSKGIRRASKEQPIILFIDDIHWSDSSSLALLHTIVKSCINDSLVVIGTYRKDELKSDREETKHLENIIKSLDREGFLVSRDLDRLDETNTRSLICENLGELANGPLGDEIVRDSEGNPLFVLELIDYLKTEDIVEWEDGNWVVTGPFEKIGLPARIKDIIASRLEKLPEEYKDLLECASVMGEVFYPMALSNALDINRLQFLKILRKIQTDYGLIEEASDGGGAYTFDHFKIRDYLYTEIPNDMRTEYHKLIAQALNDQFSRGDAVVLGDLAKHSYLGNHPDRVAFCLMAGDQAKFNFNNMVAKELYSWALDAASPEDISSIAESLGEVFTQEGNHEEAEEWYRMAMDKTSEPARAVLLASKLARTYDRLGRTKEALKTLEKHPPNDKTEPMVQAKWRSVKAWVHYRSFDYQLAELEASQAINDFGESGGGGEDIGFCWNTLGSVRYGQGKLQEAAKFYQKGIKAAEEPEGNVQTIALMNNLCLCERGLGRFKECMRLGMEALNISQKIGNRFQEGVSLNRIGNVQLFMGQIDVALDTLSKGLDISMEIGANALTSDFLQLRAKCYLERKEIGKASNDIGEAILTSFDSEDFKLFAETRLVEILVAQEEYDQAVSKAHEVILKLQKSESKYYYSLALRNLGLALWKKGDRKGAENAFKTALTENRDYILSYEYAQGIKWWGEALADWGEKEEAEKKLRDAYNLFKGMEARAQADLLEDILDTF